VGVQLPLFGDEWLAEQQPMTPKVPTKPYRVRMLSVRKRDLARRRDVDRFVSPDLDDE